MMSIFKSVKGKIGGGTLVMFKSKRGSIWAKSFKNNVSAYKAVKGLKKVGSKAFAARKAKGYKFGSTVKRMNSKRFY